MSDTVPTPANAEAPAAKHFTPEQVEQIVKERLERDRTARGDVVAQAQAAKEAAEAKVTEAQQTIETLKKTSATLEEKEAILKTSWEVIEAAIPAEKKTLIPADYPAEKKIAWFTQNRGQIFPDATLPTVNTPPPELKTDGQGSPKFHGHESEQIFAQKDPRAYLAAKQKGEI